MKHPIDRWVTKGLATTGGFLQADPRTLLRRLSFDFDRIASFVE